MIDLRSSATLAGKDINLRGSIECVIGGDGHDTITGNALDNISYGGRGNDYLDGQAGDDILYGGLGNDILIGNQGNNTLIGEEGVDTFLVLPNPGGADTILDYNPETEKISLCTSLGITSFQQLKISQVDQDAHVTFDNNQILILKKISLEMLTKNHFDIKPLSDSLPQLIPSKPIYHGTSDNDIFIKQTSYDQEIYGHEGDDTILTGAGNDILHGGAGDDELYGVTGRDLLIGGSGNDILHIEDGHDVINGGLGADIFKIHRAVSQSVGASIIFDFEVKNSGEKIDLSDFVDLTSFDQIHMDQIERKGKLTTDRKTITATHRLLAIKTSGPTAQTLVELYDIKKEDLRADHFIFHKDQFETDISSLVDVTPTTSTSDEWHI